MSAPLSLLKPPALDNTMGAWLLGAFFGVLLQGVGFHQTYRYFRLYPKDPLFLKLWVSLLLIAEVVNTALVMHTTYYYLVTNYFNPLVLLAGPVWSMKVLPVPASLTAVVTQTFFARRIYLINRRFRPIAIIAVLLILSFFASFITFTGLGWNKPTMSSFLGFSWLASLASGLIMAADLMMTITLIWFLHRNHTGVTRTDSILDFLVLYAISSGLIICIFNVLNVTFSLLWPDNLIYTAISVLLTKLYSNTFLVSLNARDSLMPARGNVHTSPFRSTVLRHTHRSSTAFERERRGAELHFDCAAKEDDLTRSRSKFGESDMDAEDAKAIELKVVPVAELAYDSLVESPSDTIHPGDEMLAMAV